MLPMPTIPDIQIFDNFLLRDPAPQKDHLLIVRQAALTAGFGTWTPKTDSVLGVNSFTGVGFQGRHDLIQRALVARTGLYPYIREPKFRVTGEETGSNYVHSDRSSGDYTAITYLSEESAVSGTGFYRYKPNEVWREGLSAMPCYSTMIDPVSGKKTFSGERLSSDMTGKRPDDPAVWEMTNFVGGLLNRCVVFRSDLFHARLPIDETGEGAENMRMVHVFHFYL